MLYEIIESADFSGVSNQPYDQHRLAVFKIKNEGITFRMGVSNGNVKTTDVTVHEYAVVPLFSVL